MEETTFFQVGGTLGLNHGSYVIRQADSDLYESLFARELVYVLDSRQKGKSSLITRVSQRLEESSVLTVKLDLQRFGSNVTVEQWYGAMLQVLITRFGNRDASIAFWKTRSDLGPLARWFAIIETIILPSVSEPIVIFVDEIDFVLALPFSADEFFTGIRDSVNRRAEDQILSRLTFCLVGVAAASQLVQDARVSPFNIGKRVRLTDFSRAELRGFEAHLSERVVDRIFYWSGGHPYLSQLLARVSTRNSPESVDRFVRSQLLSPSALETEPNFADTERRVLESTLPGYEAEESRIRILDTYQRVRKGKNRAPAYEDPAITELLLSGLIHEQDGHLSLRNRIYGEVFSDRWRADHLPGAELRRQREAASRATRRISLIFLSVSTVLTILCVILVATIRQRDAGLREAVALNEVNQRLAYEGTMQLASIESERGNFARVVTLVGSQNSSVLRGWEHTFWTKSLQEGHVILRLGIATGRINRQVWRENGSLVRNDETGFWEGAKRISDPVSVSPWRLYESRGTAALTDRLSLQAGVKVPAGYKWPLLSQNGKLLTLQTANSLAAFDPRTGQKLWEQTSAFPVQASGISPNSQMCFSEGHEQLQMHDSATGAIVWSNNLCRAAGFSFSADSTSMLVRSEGGMAHTIDCRTGKVKLTLDGHKGAVLDGAFLRTRPEILTACADGALRVFDSRTGALKRTMIGHEGPILSVTVNEDESEAITFDGLGVVRSWDLLSRPRQETVTAARDEISRCLISADGSRMIIGSKDGVFALLDTSTFRPIYRTQTLIHGDSPRLSMSPGGQSYAFLRSENTIEVGSFADGKVLKRLVVPSAVRGFTYFSNQIILCWDADNNLRTLNVENGSVNAIYRHEQAISIVRSAPNSALIAVGDMTGEVTLIRNPLTAPITVIIERKPTSMDDARVQYLEFSPDETLLAVAHYDKRISLISTDGRAETKQLMGHTARLYSARFSPDGSRLVSNGPDNTARIWDVKSGKQIAVAQFSNWVSNCAWSPDSNRIAIGGADGSLRVVNGHTAAEYFRWEGHHLIADTVQFTPDGKSIITTDSAGVIRRWNTD